MEVRAFVAADAVSVTSKGNKLVIEGVFDTVFSDTFPAQHKSLSTVLIFDDKENKFKYELFLKHKGQRTEVTKAEFTKEKKTHKIISRFKDWVIVDEGEYIFEAELNNKIVASYPIIARKI